MKDHRHLLAWQKARATSLAVFRFGEHHWSPGRASAIEQLRRAALSVQLNIAEGYASGPGARCKSHLRIAYASAVETTDILELLQELGADAESVLAPSRESQALTLRLMLTARPR
jgi:four helix bundle protein